MSATVRRILLAVILVAAAAILFRPYLPFQGDEADPDITSEPQAALEQALAEGYPVFLEMYSPG